MDRISQLTHSVLDDIDNCRDLESLENLRVKYFGKNEEFYVPGKKVDVFDTTGAGDTFLGYFLALFDKTKDIASSLDIANIAASIQVTRNGASIAIPYLKEVLNWKKNTK